MNWEQLKTILWLRWQLTRNQWRRSGGLGAFVAALIVIGALIIGGASFVGALLGGIYGLSEASPNVIMGIWLGLTFVFLLFWFIGLLAEIQRSETIDLHRLLHLPVALGQVFTINYFASHFALSIIITLPAMMGLALGLAISRSAAMLLLIPLALAMIFMVTAWTYCLRGWIAAMMTNPRRRRSVIMGITLAFILLGQAPNIYFNLINPHDKQHKRRTGETAGAGRINDQQSLNRMMSFQKFIPPFWLPVGAQALAENRPVPALLGMLGGFAIGAAGLRRAYRSTLKFYHGEIGGTAPAPAQRSAVETKASAAKTSARFLEIRLPAAPEQACALALATFRSMLRAPEVKMAWATSFLMTFILGGSLLFRSAPKLPAAAKPFIVPGLLTFSLLMLMQFLANQFGYDRDGFRALVLSPANRRLILLGKNISILPVLGGFGLFLTTFVSLWLRLPALVVLAALFQLATMFFIASLCGNLLSILMPYRIQSGSLKPTKMPGFAVLVMVLCQLLCPLAMFPLFIPPLTEFFWRDAGLSPAIPLGLLLSAALAALMAFVYWQTLEPLGRLLQRRETKILQVVSVEVE